MVEEPKTISLEQIKLLKKNIDKMSRSEEQFVLMIFKNPNGTDNITGYCYNMPPEKIRVFLEQELGRGEIRNDK